MKAQAKLCKQLFDSQRSSIRLVLNCIEETIHRNVSPNSKRVTLEILISYLVNTAHHKHHSREEEYLLIDTFQNASTGSQQATEILKNQHRSLHAASSWWMSHTIQVEQWFNEVEPVNSANGKALLQFINDYRLHLSLEETLIWRRFFHLIQPLQFAEAAFMLAQINDPIENCTSSDSIEVVCKAISKATVHLLQ